MKTSTSARSRALNSNKRIGFRTRKLLVRFLFATTAIATITACGGGGGGSNSAPDPNVNVPAALRPMLGHVTLNYSFTGFSTIFTNTSDFTANSLSADKTQLSATSAPMGVMVCQTAPVESGRQFMCGILNPSMSKDVFLLNVNGGNIVGEYTYCGASLTNSACATKLVLSHSGPVSGTVSTIAAGIQTQNLVSSNFDVAATKEAQSMNETPLPTSALENNAVIDNLTNSLNTIQKDRSQPAR